MAKIIVEWVEFNDANERVTKSKTIEGSDKMVNFMNFTELMGDLEREGNMLSYNVKEES